MSIRQGSKKGANVEMRRFLKVSQHTTHVVEVSAAGKAREYSPLAPEDTWDASVVVSGDAVAIEVGPYQLVAKHSGSKDAHFVGTESGPHGDAELDVFELETRPGRQPGSLSALLAVLTSGGTFTPVISNPVRYEVLPERRRGSASGSLDSLLRGEPTLFAGFRGGAHVTFKMGSSSRELGPQFTVVEDSGERRGKYSWDQSVTFEYREQLGCWYAPNRVLHVVRLKV